MTSDQIKQHLMGVFNKVKDYCHFAKGLDEGFFAGGVFSSLVRGEEVADYDIWFKSIGAWDSVDASIGSRAQRRSAFGTTIKLPSGEVVQLIKTRLGEPEATVSTFDFIHCQAFFVPTTGQLVYNEEFLNSKVLEFNPQTLKQHPVNTIERMLKFTRRGYLVRQQSIVDILLEAKHLDESVVRRASAHGGSR